MAKKSPTHAGNKSLIALGLAIKELRQNLNLSQEDLAEVSELDRSYIGGIERGEHNLSVISLIKISKALEVRLSDLFKISKI